MNDDGGSAFPQVETNYVGERGDYEMRVESLGGMTLRDYFAAKALQGLLATGEDFRNQDGRDGWEWHALAAYSMADAMLEAREK